MRTQRLLLSAMLALASTVAAQPVGSTPRPPAQPAAKAVSLDKMVTDRVKEVLDSVKSDADFPLAGANLTSLFDEVIAFAPAADSDAFREADFGTRLLFQVAQSPKGSRVELLDFLRANDQFAQTLVFLIKPENRLPELFGLLDRLRTKDGADLNRLASLAAAICVVHDKPLTDQVNENKATAADPVLIFEYFKSHEKSMLLPIAKMPPELLISVVNTTASIDDLNWALKKYGGDPKVGQRYFDVKYDYNHFRKGTPKKVTELGFTLPNILSYGGVCADQSYFAKNVGKAIGVPTTGVFGRNADVSHAWVGYVQTQGDQARWNFDSGHYAGYKGVRGTVRDPQTGQPMPDSSLALIAEASTTNAVSRRTAIAMTDAAVRLASIQKTASAFPHAGKTVITGCNPARQATTADRLDLLEAGLRKCPSYAPGWKLVSAAAAAGELSLKDKQRWAKTLDALCGAKYPDFSLDILTPMVRSVDDIHEQDALWNSLFASFQKRPDLAAEIRFSQGAMWEKAGDKAKAWDCYQDIIKRFADDGPFTVDAAARCEKLLKDGSKDKDITPLYGNLWPKLSKPAGMAPEFRTQSNWFRVGSLYAARLESDGNRTKAEEVKDKLGIKEP